MEDGMMDREWTWIQGFQSPVFCSFSTGSSGLFDKFEKITEEK